MRDHRDDTYATLPRATRKRAASPPEPPWQDRAACGGMSSRVFFEDAVTLAGEPKDGLPAAREICRGCLVRLDCLREAAERREEHGVWAGATPAQLRGFSRRSWPPACMGCGCTIDPLYVVDSATWRCSSCRR